jgi:apolipoprotein N-acyltransferase
LIEPRGSVTRASALHATDAQARRSALLVSGVLLAVAAWNLYRGRAFVVAAFGVPGAALALTGLLWRAGARAFHFHWMRLAVLLGHVNSRVLLTLVYYGLFAPYGLASRLLGRDPLLRRGPRRESYWVRRERTRQPREQFERLF